MTDTAESPVLHFEFRRHRPASYHVDINDMYYSGTMVYPVREFMEPILDQFQRPQSHNVFTVGVKEGWELL